MEKINDWTPQVVILGAGDYPTSPLPLHFLRTTPLVVCCDGAAEAYIQHEGKAPWRIVGDGDSLPPHLRQLYAPILRLTPHDQDTNDQTKATRYVHRHHLTRIAYLAATGRREDHTLGNISLLIDYARMGLDVRMITDHGIFHPAPTGHITLHLPLRTQLSIFAFGATHLQATGLRYPIHDFTSWWQGTLNETTLPQVIIQAQGPFLVYYTTE